MNFLRLQFSEKTAIRDFVNLTMGDREEELRRGSCSGEVGRSLAGRGNGGGGPGGEEGGVRGSWAFFCSAPCRNNNGGGVVATGRERAS